MTYPSPPDTREGHGQWCIIQRPAAGTLWLADEGERIGFDPAPGQDAAPVLALLQTAADAGRSAAEAWDMVVGMVGVTTHIGDLGHWREDRATRRRRVTA